MNNTTRFHPFPEFGSYFALIGGRLWQAPMLEDGSIDGGAEAPNCCEVEDFAGTEEIVEELQNL